MFAAKEALLTDENELFSNVYKRPRWGGDYQSGPLSELEISDEKNKVDVSTHSGPPRASFKRSIYAAWYD